MQLIYAFNGTGKTRLSREFKDLVAPKDSENEEHDGVQPRDRILYYNAFTEDLFYWDNDLENDVKPKLKIQPNTFTGWLLDLIDTSGEYSNIAENFQKYTGSKANPVFNPEYKIKNPDDKEKEIVVPANSEITFEIASDKPDDYESAIEEESNNVVQGKYEVIKISKGEESNFVWSVMYTLLQQVISNLNEIDPTNRSIDNFNTLKYVFIDDPVSSLDDNHLIELAIDLANLIKSSQSSDLKFIITTHNPLFYNVLFNEFSKAEKLILRKSSDGNHELIGQGDDSPFSYHLYLKDELNKAAESGEINKYHFNFLRNVLEKTSTFLGYKEWGELLPQSKARSNPYARVINLYNHAKHSGDEISEVQEEHKRVFKYLVKEIDSIYKGTRSQNTTQA
ncbi:AAA family ATPase [Enterovibrio coralii]|uniref:Anticodon nuclease n=1 Tax=Enterovibrio coralii TaxID=294935 RepID=A0A135I2Q7_9GAMM|nr:AAA family ATPase [Enterovibrio coralii]KXF79733.1 anticodon nuclease [Enterovibrio coralii]